MRKSSLIFLMAIAFVLTTVAAGFCVVNEIGEPCVIAQPAKGATGWVYGLEIEMNRCDPSLQGTVCPCPTFDYELGSKYLGGNYCPVQDVNGIIFKLCDCEKIDEMDATKSYAIRLTIMEPATGVYWTNSNVKRGDQPNFANVVQDCGTNVVAAPGKVNVASFLDPALSGGNYCLDANDATNSLDAAGVPTDSTSALNYYSVTKGQTLFDLATNNVNCCFTCGTNRVKAVQTCYSRLLKNLESILLIDIPTLVYDANDINVQLGSAVKVKVEIVEKPAVDDICGGACKSLCECLVKIGEFADCTPLGCSLCLPYLAVDSDWWTGLALTNPTKKADKVEITIYADGKSESKSLVVKAGSVMTVSIGDILADMDLPEAPMFGSITSSGAIEGFVMIGTGMDAIQGYVAPDGPCGCGSDY